MSENLKALQTEFKTLTKQLRETVESQTDEVAEFKNFTVDSKANIDKINTRLTEIEVALKSKSTVTNETKNSKFTDNDIEYKSKFVKDYMKKGKTFEMESKAMYTEDVTQGGMFIPKIMSSTIVEKLRDFSPIRSIATIETISRGSSFSVPVEKDPDMGAGWVGERESRNDTDNPKFDLIEIPCWEMYAQPTATRQMLDDAEFDVEAWYSRKVSDKFGRIEGSAFVNGDGVKKPIGIMVSDRVTNYNGTMGGTTQFDDLITFQAQIRQGYQSMSQWLLNRFTLAYIRTLKDQDGQYLWQPSLQPGAPATMLGKPYTIADDMSNAIDNTGSLITGNSPIAYGSFMDGYTIVDKTVVVVIRDDITSKPYIKYYTTKRTGGDVVDNQAIVKFTLE